MDLLAAQTPIPGLPLELHGLAAVAVVAGAVLWLMGSRVVKPIFAVLGLVIGAAMGFIVLPVFGPDQIQEIPSPWIGLGAGALIGLIGAVVMFRFTIAVAAAGVVGVASVFGASIYLQYADAQQTADALGIDTTKLDAARELGAEELLFENVPVLGDQPVDDRTAAESSEGEPETQLAERIRTLLEATRVELANAWNNVPALDRVVLLGAGGVGASLGLLFGLAAPKRSSAMVTSLAGSGIGLAGLTFFAEQLTLPGGEALHEPRTWVIAWGVAAVVGFIFQVWRLRRAKALA